MLDMNYFEKNREFVTRTADGLEEGLRQAGYDFSKCPDALLEEIVDGAANSFGRALFELLKVRKDLQKNN